VNCAGTTLGYAAGKFGTDEPEMIPEDPKKRSVVRYFDGVGFSVDFQVKVCHGLLIFEKII
jgi:hypothetical protein